MAVDRSSVLPTTGPGAVRPALPTGPAAGRPPGRWWHTASTGRWHAAPTRWWRTAPTRWWHAVRAHWHDLSRRQALALAGTLAALTSLTALGVQPLSWDESVTAAAAERTLPNLARLLAHTDIPLGGYYLLMHGWVRMLALASVYPSEGALRLPSALAAIGAVLVTTAFAGRWWGPRVGLAAGTLLAVQPMFVFYAHDARPYTIATLLAVGATAVLVPALRDPRPGRLVAYAALATAAVYAHLFVLMLLLVHAWAVLRHGRRRRRWLPVGVAVAAAAAPLVWLGHRQIGELGWIPSPTPAAVASVLFRIGGSAMLPPMLATVLVAWRSRRPDRVAGTPGAMRTLITGWAVLPPVLLVLADFLQPVLVARYALITVPAAVIGTAVVAARARRRSVAVLLTVAALCGLVNSVAQQAQPYKYENYRAAVELILGSARPGDGVIFLPSVNRVSFDIYLRQERDERQLAPTDLALAPNDGPLVASQIAGGDVTADVLSRRIPSYPRLFLVGFSLRRALATRHSAVGLVEARMLSSGYHSLWTRRYGVVTVSLFARDPAPVVAASPSPAR